MAIMVPRIPKDYTPESKEDLIFHALEKLSDDYYVFHSFKMLDIIDSVWSEREIDFTAPSGGGVRGVTKSIGLAVHTVTPSGGGGNENVEGTRSVFLSIFLPVKTP